MSILSVLLLQVVWEPTNVDNVQSNVKQLEKGKDLDNFILGFQGENLDNFVLCFQEKTEIILFYIFKENDIILRLRTL